MWEGSVWMLMDLYGPVLVRMVPGDSLGASWGLLGPWGAQKEGFRVFVGGGGTPPKNLKPPFRDPRAQGGPRRPQEAPRESSGTIRTHTGPYGSITIHTDPSHINFKNIFGHFSTTFSKQVQKIFKTRRQNIEN